MSYSYERMFTVGICLVVFSEVDEAESIFKGSFGEVLFHFGESCVECVDAFVYDDRGWEPFHSESHFFHSFPFAAVDLWNCWDSLDVIGEVAG